jgi:hypothetical protein
MTETILRTKSDVWGLCEQLTEMDLTKPLVVTIKPQKDVRSLSQNSTYWMWLAEISRWSGHDKDELHTLFRRKFLTPEQRKILGEDCWVLQSTTALSTAEMASYMDRVYRFAAEFGIQLPLPEEMAA